MKNNSTSLTRVAKEFIKIVLDQKLIFMVLIAIVSAFYIGQALAITPGSDILSNAQADITANFGTSSTVMYIVYVAEIFAGISAYIKTKNLFALIGLVIVVIFTYVAFGLI